MASRLHLGLAGLAAAAVLGGTVLTAGSGMAAVSHGSGSAAMAMPTAPAGHRCYIGDLSAGLHPQQPRTRDYGFILTLTNVSGSPCWIYGYPGLGLENANRHVLRSRTFWGSTSFDTDPGRQMIALSPGETASGDVAFAAGCGGALASYLKVTPPNDYLHFVLRIPGGPYGICRGNLYATAMSRHTPF